MRATAMPVPSMGWFATCSDGQGNSFGLWQTDPSASMYAPRKDMSWDCPWDMS